MGLDTQGSLFGDKPLTQDEQYARTDIAQI
jgi:hypothetical protein